MCKAVRSPGAGPGPAALLPGEARAAEVVGALAARLLPGHQGELDAAQHGQITGIRTSDEMRGTGRIVGSMTYLHISHSMALSLVWVGGGVVKGWLMTINVWGVKKQSKVFTFLSFFFRKEKDIKKGFLWLHR